MSVPTLDQLYSAKSKDEVLAVVLEVAQAVGLPITAWQSGSVGRELLEICSQIASNYSDVSTVIASGGLLDYATAAWLTLNAFEIYEVAREDATFGTCTERLTSTANVSYTLNPGDMRFYNTASGKTYTSTTGGTLAPGNITPQTLDLTIVADEAGSASNAAVGDITGIVTPLFGVTATNLETLVGNDEESDDALRIRARESMAKASPNGPSDAYNYFAKTATRSTDGTAIGVTRTNLVEGNGTITVYVADASGPIDSQDLSDVDTAIQLNCVPTGFTAVTLNANPVNVPISATIYLQIGSTLTIDQLTTLITKQLTAYFGAAPIGGYQAGGGFIFTSAIIGQMFEASSQIVRAVLTAPSADVALTADQVGVLGAITLTLAPS